MLEIGGNENYSKTHELVRIGNACLGMCKKRDDRSKFKVTELTQLCLLNYHKCWNT